MVLPKSREAKRPKQQHQLKLMLQRFRISHLHIKTTDTCERKKMLTPGKRIQYHFFVRATFSYTVFVSLSVQRTEMILRRVWVQDGSQIKNSCQALSNKKVSFHSVMKNKYTQNNCSKFE